jgi:DNA-binding IclR family transcriptional regulator
MKHISEGTRKNQSLRKALHILEEMTKIQTPARLQDIAHTLKMPQSTLLRFLNTYIDFGYVGQEPNTSCYYLTLKLSELGSRTKDRFPFQRSLAKYVKQIAERFNEAASLCVEHDMRMVYVAAEDGPDRMLKTLRCIGHIAPMHATGVGKLHLMNYSHNRLLELRQKHGFPQYTERTITDLPKLKEEIENIRSQGYALDNEECESGVRCVAAPIRDYTGFVAAAFSLSAPVSRLDPSTIQEIAAYLTSAGLKASRELGWDPEHKD